MRSAGRSPPAVRRAPDVNFGEISYRDDSSRINEPSRDPRPAVPASDPNALPNPQAQPPSYGQQYPPQQAPSGYQPPQG